MKVALVASGVPNPAAGGATLTNWTVVSYLLARGHEVVVMPLLQRDYRDATEQSAVERIERLRELGALVHPIESATDDGHWSPTRTPWARARRMWRPEAELLFPHLLDRAAVHDALGEEQPDVAFVYHWEALAATYRISSVPKLGVAVDLAHLPALYRWRAELRRPSTATLRAVVRLQAQARRQPSLMVKLLNDCAAAGDFAAHHAAWLRKHGARRCEYLRTPIPDPGTPPQEPGPAGRRPRVLLIGHLRGTATTEGLDLFAREILPRLERALGADAFEVRVVGGHELPAFLARALDRPSVAFCGHLEDPSAEFRSADVLLVPTTIPLGTRVRILSAFSYRLCVVAHRSNALGIPELAHRRNVLLGRNAEELSHALLETIRDERLRHDLGREGRATYERYFSPPVAAGLIESTLAEIAAS